MISRAANRTSSERSSAASLRPSIRVLNFSRVRSDAGILSIGVLLRGGRSPNRTSLVRLIRRGCTPTLFPASLGLHQLNASTPLQSQNFEYINEYQGLIVTQGSLIQAALVRQDLSPACSVLAQLERALTSVNGKYR